MTNPPFADEAADADEPVGAALARWRKRKKMSGQELGDRVGMSQPKVSRLETGASSPDPHDVRRIAEALDLPSSEIERLVGLADRSSNQFIDWHSIEPGLVHRQHSIRTLEWSAREMRVFQPAVLPGLLQTSEYARAILTGVRLQLADDQIADSALAVAEAVTARLQRSQGLNDPRRHFQFLITEAALAHQVCRPADMLAQISRVHEVAAQPNVSIRIIPNDADWPIAPFHGFVLIEDRHVVIDLFNTALLSKGRRTTRHYRRVFDALDSVATDDIGPLLDAYQQRYIRRLPKMAPDTL